MVVVCGSPMPGLLAVGKGLCIALILFHPLVSTTHSYLRTPELSCEWMEQVRPRFALLDHGFLLYVHVHEGAWTEQTTAAGIVPSEGADSGTKLL